MIKAIHQSTLGSWLRCGESFRRRYIEGEIIPPGIAARRGSGAHKAAEVNHRQKIKSGIDLPLGDLKDAARDEYMRLIKDEGVFLTKDELPSKDKILNEGLNQTIQATEVYRAEVAPKIQPVRVEEKITIDVPGIALPISGMLDAEDDKGFIQDLKVAKRKNQEWADREVQVGFYYLLRKGSIGDWPKGFKYQFIIPNKTMLHEELTTYRNMKQIQVLFRYIEQFLKDLKEGNFKPADPGSWLCNPEWCGYYRDCKYSS
jgi:hypothetical protein